eukprot:6456833-Pyramimonas_sp.AAC.1
MLGPNCLERVPDSQYLFSELPHYPRAGIQARRGGQGGRGHPLGRRNPRGDQAALCARATSRFGAGGRAAGFY